MTQVSYLHVVDHVGTVIVQSLSKYLLVIVLFGTVS